MRVAWPVQCLPLEAFKKKIKLAALVTIESIVLTFVYTITHLDHTCHTSRGCCERDISCGNDDAGTKQIAKRFPV